jgi:membrane dipeptidase
LRDLQPIPIIDGHNDVLLRLWLKKSARAAADFVEGDGLGHIDLPRIHLGGMAAGFFAIFVPSQVHHTADDEDINPPYDESVVQIAAMNAVNEMLDLRDEIVRLANGDVFVCRSLHQMQAAITAGKIAWITHIEGAEAIAPDLSNLQALYDRGLRSLGPVWSRPNAFGEGVPFRFPSSPDTGGGLTDAGVALIKACNDLRILVDLSHITERGFWDAAKHSSAPLVATHSNAHAVSPHSRNLTNEQLLAIGESKGLVGLNFATGFLREDGKWDSLTQPDVMIKHLEHMIRFAGEDCVGFGSDFDGARVPSFIGGVTGYPKLIEAMKNAGFGQELVEKIAYRNWLRVLEVTWKA